MSFLLHPSSLAIFDVGTGEMMLIFFIVLLLFGGKKMPEFARGLGKSIHEFKKATSGVEDEIKRAMEEPAPAPAANAGKVIEPATPSPKLDTHDAPPPPKPVV